ncbi:aspartokinase [Histoplasma capsulatum H143]|uniref:Aspartokinase n=1 Tax=Ajellomyces capsulatus (strain H143) TaxID=544712 RepID=C6HG88_AJECH|nr:aspartokinase [Histoplasma capsulatum H143]
MARYPRTPYNFSSLGFPSPIQNPHLLSSRTFIPLLVRTQSTPKAYAFSLRPPLLSRTMSLLSHLGVYGIDNVPLTNGITAHPTEWVVQKFGGTSVGKFAVDIVDRVIYPSTLTHRVAVVCSARSSSSKADGTTNRLLRAAREAGGTMKSTYYVALVDAVRHEHVQVAQDLLRNPELKEQLINAIEDECTHTLKILEAAQTLGEITAKCVDKVISTGEKLSCRIMAALLEDHGVESEYIDLSDVIYFATSAQSLDQTFYDRLVVALAEKIEACGSKVPVITGYFGPVPGGLLDKIGRGYTDLCAALVAVGINAHELQVWKEVDVPTARLLPAITPAEAAELTFYGSEVIHPFTMEQVIRARIPIRIKNVMKPRGKGTAMNQRSSVRGVPAYFHRISRARNDRLQ